MSDSYRPSYDAPRARGHGPPGYDRGTPPPPPYGAPHSSSYDGQPPLPSGPPPPMHRFGREAGPQNDFSFRANNDAYRYPEQSRHQNYDDHGRRAQGRRREFGPRRGDRPGGRGNYRGRGPKVATASRPLLTFERGNTPDQLAGMNGDGAGKKFIDMGDVSDSSEQSMDESESELEECAQEDEATDEPNKKRKKSSAQEEAKAQEIPRWSNPEVYTALPPLLEQPDRKKKDVVKLIRKARVVPEKDSKPAAPVNQDVDFIAFDLGDDDGMQDAPINGNHANKSVIVSGAPSGPRALEKKEETIPAIVSGQMSAISKPLAFAPPLVYRARMPDSTAGIDLTTSVAALLNGKGLDKKRKRDDSDSEYLIAPKVKKGRGHVVGSEVLRDWANISLEKAHPWITEDHTFTANNGFRLHKEICDFYDFVKPRPFEEAMRAGLLVNLQAAISKKIPNATVQSFGSFNAGLYLPNADMDVVVVSNSFMKSGMKCIGQGNNQMRKIAHGLEMANVILPGSLEVISKSKVPLIKYVDRTTRLKVDLSFENATGIVANGTFQEWKAQFPAMPILVTIIKQFLLMRGLNDVATGGIGGFSVTCLVTSMLQQMPRVQLRELQPEHHLGELLLEFLDFYGNRFDFVRSAIRMEPPGYIEKRYSPARKDDRLCIIDPNTTGNDISGGTQHIGLIFKSFSHARTEILSSMESPGRKSLLDCLAGNYNDFLWHRKHLRHLYEKTYNGSSIHLSGDETFGLSDDDDDALELLADETSHLQVGLTSLSHVTDTNTPVARENHAAQSRESSQQKNNEILARTFRSIYPEAAAWCKFSTETLTSVGYKTYLMAWNSSGNGRLNYDSALNLARKNRQDTQQASTVNAPKKKKGKSNSAASRALGKNDLRVDIAISFRSKYPEVAAWAKVNLKRGITATAYEKCLQAWENSQNGAIAYKVALKKVNEPKRQGHADMTVELVDSTVGSGGKTTEGQAGSAIEGRTNDNPIKID